METYKWRNENISQYWINLGDLSLETIRPRSRSSGRGPPRDLNKIECLEYHVNIEEQVLSTFYLICMRLEANSVLSFPDCSLLLDQDYLSHIFIMK